MDRRTLIDEMHAMAEGSLAPEDEARLRSRCEADPDLKQMLEQVRISGYRMRAVFRAIVHSPSFMKP